MPRWTGPKLSLADFRAALLAARDDCAYQELTATNGRVGARFVRTLPSGKVRSTAPFFPDQFGRELSAGTVEAFCRALDLDSADFGVDDTWTR